jgi:multisubunit Na+/H+ antiporter MnhG subunit
MSAVFLLGTCFALVGLVGYVRAVSNLTRLHQLNHERGKPAFTDCDGVLLDLFGAAVVCLLGAAIVGMGA